MQIAENISEYSLVCISDTSNVYHAIHPLYKIVLDY